MRKYGKIIILFLTLVLNGCFNPFTYFENNEECDCEVTRLNTTVRGTVSEEELTKVYEDTVKSTVTVFVSDSLNQLASTGSGVVIGESEVGDRAYIYTNAHVVSATSPVIEVVFYNNIRVSATLVAKDDREDVAVISVKASNNYEVAVIGSSDNLKVGQSVLAIGSPLGLNYSNTLTTGIVSGLNVKVSANVNKESVNMYMIQIDAALNPGNSGGPLFNIYGELIGINTLKIVLTESGDDVESFNFSIPIDHFQLVAKTIVEDKIEYKRPLIGITVIDISSISLSERKRLNITEEIGLYIDSVIARGPSDPYLKKGNVIVGINGRKTSNMNEFAAVLNKYMPGDCIEVDLIKNGNIESVKITLGAS
ncbi:TPA: trypsin-like serine protease [bacterium]|nr:trypsin-like serine protease [bacterium]